MSSVLKISDAASLAMHAMALLGARPGEVLSTREMASGLGVSEAHLSKVLQRLNKVGLLSSVRGARGGFVLDRDPGDVSLLDVYEAIDGRLAPSDCLLGRRACDGTSCILGDLLGRVNALVFEHFSSRTVADLAGPFVRPGQGAALAGGAP